MSYVACTCGYQNKPARSDCARCKAPLAKGKGAGAAPAASSPVKAAPAAASPSKGSAAPAAAPASPAAAAAAAPAAAAGAAKADTKEDAKPAVTVKVEAKAESKGEVKDDGAEWTLYYWPKTLGRGEFIRLMFSVTGTKFSEPYGDRDPAEAAAFFFGPTKPFFAVPAIRHRTGREGDLYLSQTPVLMRYLAKKLAGGRLSPKTEREEFQAEVLSLGVADFLQEGTHAWHAIDHSASYASQAKETQPHIDKYIEKRLPKWASFFEQQLKANNGGKGWFIGQNMTYVDVAVWFIFEGVRAQLPQEYEKLNMPLVKAFVARVESLPAIEAHRKNRVGPFTMTGPCT